MEVGHCPGCQVMEVLYCLKLFSLHFFFSSSSSFVILHVIVLFIRNFFPVLLWRDVPYPSRPCSSAARSLKLLLSFPSGINSLIFSAPKHFTPILSQHRHCLPIRFSVFCLPCPTSASLGGEFVPDYFGSSSASTVSSPSYSLN